MKTLSNLWRILTREAGEIRDWIKPFATKIAGLLVVGIVVVSSTITLAFPFLAHPQGWAGYVAQLLQSFCAQDTACTYEQMYPSFSLFVLVLATTAAFLVIILHMYAHRYDPDLDEIDTVSKVTLEKLERIEKIVCQDLELDQEALNIRVIDNGTRK